MPLSGIDIKIEILKRGDTISGLARRWDTTPEILGRVIWRRWSFVYPDIRRKLARYLGVKISEVGQDPKRKPKKKAA
jgi:hypothetical protein